MENIGPAFQLDQQSSGVQQGTHTSYWGQELSGQHYVQVPTVLIFIICLTPCPCDLFICIGEYQNAILSEPCLQHPVLGNARETAL